MPPPLLFTSISPRFPLLASTRKPIHLPMKDRTHTPYGAVYFPPRPRLRSVIVSPNFNSSDASNATDSRCDAFKIRLAVGLASLLHETDANKHCSWCHYLSCVPTGRWSCR